MKPHRKWKRASTLKTSAATYTITEVGEQKRVVASWQYVARISNVAVHIFSKNLHTEGKTNMSQSQQCAATQRKNPPVLTLIQRRI